MDWCQPFEHMIAGARREKVQKDNQCLLVHKVSCSIGGVILLVPTSKLCVLKCEQDLEIF